MSAAKNPFGDGYAAERIVEAIRYYFGLRKDRPEDYKGEVKNVPLLHTSMDVVFLYLLFLWLDN